VKRHRLGEYLRGLQNAPFSDKKNKMETGVQIPLFILHLVPALEECFIVSFDLH
jgi:hypothetical protein